MNTNYFSDILVTITSYIHDNFIDALSLVAYMSAGVMAIIQWRDSNRSKRSEYVDHILNEIRSNSDMHDFIDINDYESEEWYTDSFHHGTDNEKVIAKKADATLFYINYLCFMEKTKLIKQKESALFDYHIRAIANNINTKRYLFDLYQYCIHNNKEFPYQFFLSYCIEKKILPKKMMNKNYYCEIMKAENSRQNPIPKSETVLIIENILNYDSSSPPEHIPLYIESCRRCDYCTNRNGCKNIKEHEYINIAKPCPSFSFCEKIWEKRFGEYKIRENIQKRIKDQIYSYRRCKKK